MGTKPKIVAAAARVETAKVPTSKGATSQAVMAPVETIPAEVTPVEMTPVETIELETIEIQAAPVEALATPTVSVTAPATEIKADDSKMVGTRTTMFVSAPAPAQIRMSMEKAMKSTEEFVAFGQGNVEAFVKSSQIWSAGVQDLSKQVAAMAQANFDETMNVFKAFSGLKTPKDAFDMQANYARAAFEKSMAESSKITDASLKLTEQALAPITARMTQAMETLVKPA